MIDELLGRILDNSVSLAVLVAWVISERKEKADIKAYCRKQYERHMSVILRLSGNADVDPPS